MRSRLKVTVTIDKAVLEEIDRMATEQKESRSRLIEEAIKAWRQIQIEKELIDGYTAMAEEDLKTAEANLEAGVEVVI